MKNKKVDMALANLDEAYITQSCDFDGVKTQFKKSKTKKIKIASAFCACLVICASAFAAFALFKDGDKPSDAPQTENGVYNIALFEGTITEGVDSFGADEIHSVGLYVDGNAYYKQVDVQSLTEYALPAQVDEADLEEIGKVKELTEENGWDETLFDVSAKEPNLKGATAYYYKSEESKAVIVALKDGKCSFFLLSNLCNRQSEAYFKDYFELFGVKGAEDISEIVVYEWVGEYDESNTAIIKEKSVTDGENIKALYGVLVGKDSAEDIGKSSNYGYSCAFTIKLKNGKLLDNGGHKFAYSPYHGTGGVDYKGAITAEENAVIKEAFGVE